MSSPRYPARELLYDDEFSRAMAGERDYVAHLWRVIDMSDLTGGENDLSRDQALQWLKKVARRIVIDVLDFDGPTNYRGQQAIEALHLSDRGEDNWYELRALRVYYDAENLIIEPHELRKYGYVDCGT